jgi:hypothetical protein
MPPKPFIIALSAIFIIIIITIIPFIEQISFHGSESSEIINQLTCAIISLILFGGALWVIVSQRYTPTDRHWAYGTVGTIVGFWLHT